MAYNNAAYWTELHRELTGTLRSVGFPRFSERFNELKYASEAESLHAVFQMMADKVRHSGTVVRVLDVGAGTGYWTKLTTIALKHLSLQARVTALDISTEALAVLKQRNPEADTVQADLTTVDPDRFQGQFDMVMSFYCLHHLPRHDGFLNALRFAATSVRPGGALIIMDPVLSMPYSRFDSFDFSSWKSNGIPRHLYLLDDILSTLGLKRLDCRPAVSFLLNGNVEAGSRICYSMCNRLWSLLGHIYRSETLTVLASPLLHNADRLCKRIGWAYSSSLCTYRRETA
jgi:SAM-dependent methyltransferase